MLLLESLFLRGELVFAKLESIYIGFLTRVVDFLRNHRAPAIAYWLLRPFLLIAALRTRKAFSKICKDGNVADLRRIGAFLETLKRNGKLARMGRWLKENPEEFIVRTRVINKR